MPNFLLYQRMKQKMLAFSLNPEKILTQLSILRKISQFKKTSTSPTQTSNPMKNYQFKKKQISDNKDAVSVISPFWSNSHF